MARIAALEELKGLAILLVMIFHAACALHLPNLSRGHSGADIFLLLSGLGLAWGLKEESTGRFLVRRLVAVMPRYWLALAVIVVLNGWISGHWESVRGVGLHVLALHAFTISDFYGINISWWFIGVIVPLYGVAALVRPWLRTGQVDRIIATGLVLTAASRLAGQAAEADALAGHLTGCVPEFFLGLVVGCALRLGPAALTIRTPTTGWALLGYALMAGAVDPALLTNPDPLFALAWIAWYLMIIDGGGLHRLRRVFAFLGSISFELYLYHQPFLTDYNDRFWRWLTPGTAPDAFHLILGMAGGFALVVGACLLARKLLRFLPTPSLAASAVAVLLAWAGYGMVIG